jgi:hypothetical protein
MDARLARQWDADIFSVIKESTNEQLWNLAEDLNQPTFKEFAAAKVAARDFAWQELRERKLTIH